MHIFPVLMEMCLCNILKAGIKRLVICFYPICLFFDQIGPKLQQHFASWVGVVMQFHCQLTIIIPCKFAYMILKSTVLVMGKHIIPLYQCYLKTGGSML